MVTADANNELLLLEGLSKSFGSTRVLEDLSLTIPRGSFCTLLGPSGCGKTTLLRLIAGLESLDAGRIVFFGRDVSHLPVSRRNCSILFQSYALFPTLSVEGNISYGLRARRLPKGEIRAKVSELLELVGLAGLEKRYPSELSGGQQQRVALARALAIEPQVLLLDEPLSALDAQVRLHLRTQIRLLQRRLGVTTIMVTHDQDEALSISDHIFLLLDGAIQQSGSPEELYLRPRSRFVADFIGSANFLEGWKQVDDRTFSCGKARLQTAFETPLTADPTTLMIRPEHLRIVPGSESNGIPATVDWAEFQGAKQRFGVTTDPAFSGSAIALEIDCSLSSGHFKPGTPIRVVFPQEHLRVFPSKE